jgi:hypothetical protein
MTATVFLPQEIWEQALQIAIHEAFPEVIRVLRLFRNGSADLKSEEAASLVDFSRFLLHRAELHFPYWDDTRVPYSQDHEDAVHEINMGIHEKLCSHIGSCFPELVK